MVMVITCLVCNTDWMGQRHHGNYTGFAAATTRTVEWTIPSDAPAALYYWCHHHTGQGNSFAVSDPVRWSQLLDIHSSIGELKDVDMAANGGPSDGQVLKWVASANAFQAANDDSTTGGGGGTTQNLFETVNADTGTTTASAANDTLIIAGGSSISTSISGDTVTIAYTGAVAHLIKIYLKLLMQILAPELHLLRMILLHSLAAQVLRHRSLVLL